MSAAEHAAWEYALVRVAVYVKRLDDSHAYAVFGRERFRQKLTDSGELDAGAIEWVVSEFDARTQGPRTPFEF